MYHVRQGSFSMMLRAGDLGCEAPQGSKGLWGMRARLFGSLMPNDSSASSKRICQDNTFPKRAPLPKLQTVSDNAIMGEWFTTAFVAGFVSLERFW